MRRRDERGSITPFVVIISLALIMLAALVVDGGRQLNAKGRAIAYAQEAARAGSQAIDVTDPRLDLVPDLALRAASAYCDQARAKDPQLVRCAASLEQVRDGAGTFTAVRVDAQIQIDAILLGIIRKPVLMSSGAALARPVSGISEADSGKVPTVAPPSLSPPSQGTPTATAPPTPDEIEVTPCAPRPTETPKGDKDDDKDKDKDDKDKDDDLEECKKPE